MAFRNTYLCLFLWGIQWLIYQSGFAQFNARFTTYSTKDGLAGSVVRDILQDKRGFLWIATNNGLSCFDGVSFLNFSAENGMTDNAVESISEDENGRIWVATKSGLCSMDPMSGQFQYYRNNLPLITGTVHCNKKGEVLFGCEKGLYILNTQGQEKRHVKLELSAHPEKKSNRYVSDILSSGNTYYLATSNGLYAIHQSSYAVRHYLPENSSKTMLFPALTRLSADDSGNILTGCYYGGVYQLAKGTNLLQLRWKTETAVYQSAKFGEYLWLADDFGIMRKVLKGNENAVRIKGDNQKLNQLPMGSIYRIFPDRIGNLWFASDRGLVRYSRNDNLFSERFYSPYFDNAYIRIIHYLPELQTFLIAVNEKLFSFNLISKQTKLIHSNDAGAYIFECNKIMDEYWITSKSGIIILDRELSKTGILNNKTAPEFPANNINQVFSMGGDEVLIITNKSASFFYHLQNKSVRKLKGNFLENHTLNAGVLAPNGDLWLGTDAGIGIVKKGSNTIDEKKLALSSSTKEIRRIRDFLCVEQDIYISTAEGLFKYSLVSATTEKIMLGNRMQIGTYKMVLSHNNSIIVGAVNGIYQYHIKSKSWSWFNKENGLEDEEVFTPIWLLKNNKIAISQLSEILLFQTTNADMVPKPEYPRFRRIKVNGELLPLQYKLPIQLHYNETIELEFANLNFYQAYANTYKYRFVGIDENWHDIGAERVLRFVNLPGGKYTLQINAANINGEWGEIPSEITFVVIPPFWKTPRFLVLIFLLLVTIGYLLFRYRINSLLKMQKMRASIASDLHDDIGATLSSIALYSEAAKKKTDTDIKGTRSILDKISETSSTMMANMSDIVWSINPDNDGMVKLLERMEEHARRLCQTNDIKLHFTKQFAGLEKENNPDVRKNIFLIFKEAINNALKYSGTDRLEIFIAIKNGNLNMRIIDFGSGFDIDLKKTGNGLHNMETRAREINGTLSITSTPEVGTIVELNATGIT